MNINTLSIEEKIGQMLCFAFHGTSYNDQLKTLIENLKIGNIVHFARNIDSIKQVAKLNQEMQEHATIPLFISIDQEGGMVRRIVNDITYLPGAMLLAATNRQDISKITYLTALDLKSLGFNVNYAPVADINNNYLNPVINSRSYSDDPKVVEECVIKAFKGIQDAKILATAKHFPGHGDTNVDSHIGLPVVNKSEEQIFDLELRPFIGAIENGIDGIMMSHILYSQLDSEYPSSLSYEVITNLLKNKLGFKGIITTDSLTMGAIWTKYSISEIIEKGVNAGNDILVFCGKADLNEQIEIVKTFIDLVKNRIISEDRINKSVAKILKYKEKYCVSNQHMQLGSGNKLAYELINNGITKIESKSLLPLHKNDKVLVIFPKIKLATLVDNENNEYESLGRIMDLPEIIISEDEIDLNFIKQESQKYDKIIMASYNAKSNDYQDLVYNLLDKDKTIVIALRSPYDYYILSGASTYVFTYDCTKENMQLLKNKLYNNEFNGILPIKLNEVKL